MLGRGRWRAVLLLSHPVASGMRAHLTGTQAGGAIQAQLPLLVASLRGAPAAQNRLACVAQPIAAAGLTRRAGCAEAASHAERTQKVACAAAEVRRGSFPCSSGCSCHAARVAAC